MLDLFQYYVLELMLETFHFVKDLWKFQFHISVFTSFLEGSLKSKSPDLRQGTIAVFSFY